MVSKKHLQLLLVRPAALTVLFFVAVVWLYFAFFVFLPRVPIGHQLKATLYRYWNEAWEREYNRLSTPWTFLAGIFRGDFGISYRTGNYVSSDLFPSVPVTLSLMGISIVLCLAIGILGAFLARFRKPGTIKPQAFGHSFRGYLFGLVPLIGLLSLLIFALDLHWLPSSGIFPRELAVNASASLAEQIAGQLQYFALPLLTLSAIFFIRTLIIVWSSGRTLFSSGWAKRFVFIWKAIDIVFIISAVVLIEWIFTIPGLGLYLSRAIQYQDYNGMIGAFIMFLTVAIAFGYLTTITDYLFQRFYGPQDLLDSNKNQKNGKSERFEENEDVQAKKVIPKLAKKKSFIAAFSIVIFLVALGALTPLMTPYNAVYDNQLAAPNAKPLWLPQLFNLNYSLNTNLINDPGFNLPSSLSEWNITVSPGVTFIYDSQEGSSRKFGGSGLGCLDISFVQRVQIFFKMDHTFYYFHSAPPSRFIGNLSWKVSAISQGSSYQIRVRLKTPTSTYDIYVSERNTENTDGNWTSPYAPGIDSYSYSVRDALDRQLNEVMQDPLKEIFNVQGYYSYSIEIDYINTQGEAKVEGLNINLDDASFKLIGDTFGLLGTDYRGRDVWNQLFYGIRSILVEAAPLAISAMLIGVVLGLIISRSRGLLKGAVTTVIDTVSFIPVLPFLMIQVFLYSPSAPSWGLWASILIISIPSMYAFGFAYEVYRKGSLENGVRRQVSKLLRSLLTAFCFAMMGLVLLLPMLGFAGLFDYNVGGWGSMLYNAWNHGEIQFWWLWLPAMILMAILAAGFFLLGYLLDDQVE